MLNTKQRIRSHADRRTRRPGDVYEVCAGAGREIINAGSNGLMAECPTCRHIVRTVEVSK